jgi:sugar-specific transcriptional regulator TrmB
MSEFPEPAGLEQARMLIGELQNAVMELEEEKRRLELLFMVLEDRVRTVETILKIGGPEVTEQSKEVIRSLAKKIGLLHSHDEIWDAIRAADKRIIEVGCMAQEIKKPGIRRKAQDGGPLRKVRKAG